MARVFDAERIRALCRRAARMQPVAAPPVQLVIALGSQQPYAALARELAEELSALRMKTVVKPEANLIRRARYPRLFDPYIKVFRPAPGETEAAGLHVKREVTLESAADGRTVARTTAGQEVGEDWREPGTVATVTGEGFVDLPYEQFYEPGCRLFVQTNGQIQVVKGKPVMVKATPEAKQRWSRPWVRLSSYLGTDKLCPQLPEAYSVNEDLILVGDSTSGELIAALQASELLPQVADAKYPGPGKALVSVANSPFALGRDAILIGACDGAGVRAGVDALLALLRVDAKEGRH
jgi:hypothetical protein